MEYYSDDAVDLSSTFMPSGSTYLFGVGSYTQSLEITLPNWEIVSNGTVYYFYNQSGSQDLVLLTLPGSGMVFQGSDPRITNSTTLTIPQNEGIRLVIMGNYYTTL